MMRPAGSLNDKCCGAQPLRALHEPLSSSAFRKTCDTVGVKSPAAAIQDAGASSASAPCTRRVIVSPVSFIVLAVSAELKGRFDFDRDAARQRAGPDRGPGMPAGIAEHLDHQIGGAVDDLRHVGEIGCAVDEPAEPQAAADAVEIAAGGDAQMRDDVEGAEARRLLPVGDADA